MYEYCLFNDPAGYLQQPMEHTAACVRFSVQSASSSPACPQRKGMRRMSIMNVAGYSVRILSRPCLCVEDVL